MLHDATLLALPVALGFCVTFVVLFLAAHDMVIMSLLEEAE
jgi:hypothetical protein